MREFDPNWRPDEYTHTMVHPPQESTACYFQAKERSTNKQNEFRAEITTIPTYEEPQAAHEASSSALEQTWGEVGHAT